MIQTVLIEHSFSKRPLYAIKNATISPLDRGFLFADGIYEVIPIYQGKPFRLDKHLKRWQRSLEAIRLTFLRLSSGRAHSTDSPAY